MLQLVCNNCWRLTGYVLYEVTLQMFQMVPFFGSGGRAPQLTLPETGRVALCSISGCHDHGAASNKVGAVHRKAGTQTSLGVFFGT
jgi:hypothetical protein